MTAAIITAIVLFLILTIRVGISAEYSDDGFSAVLNVAFIKMTIYPTKKKAADHTQSKNKKATENTENETKNKKGGLLPKFWGILELAQNTLSRLRKKLLIDRLIIHYTSGSDDPFDAVMAYGYTAAGINAIYPAFTNIFKIKESEFFTSVDFTLTQPVIYVNIRLSLSVFAILYIAIFFFIDYFRIKKDEKTVSNAAKNKDNNRKVDSNGK